MAFAQWTCLCIFIFSAFACVVQFIRYLKKNLSGPGHVAGKDRFSALFALPFAVLVFRVGEMVALS